MGVLSLSAQAKVNLFLAVGERMPTGYHQIQTVLQSVSLADELIISPASDITFTCDDQSLSQEANLVVRAAHALRERCAPGQGAALSLKKKIPVGAGLGGGSADAAAALVGLADFWDVNVSLEELREIAAGLGADIPFCLTGGTAMATGLGEKIKPLPDLELGEFLIVKPHGSLSTAQVYREWDRISRGGRSGQINRSGPRLKAFDPPQRAAVIKSLDNDLERAAQSLLPEIQAIREKALHFGAEAAMVTGSGSAIMVFPSTNIDAQGLALALAAESVTTFVVHAVRDGVVVNDAN